MVRLRCNKRTTLYQLYISHHSYSFYDHLILIKRLSTFYEQLNWRWNSLTASWQSRQTCHISRVSSSRAVLRTFPTKYHPQNCAMVSIRHNETVGPAHQFVKTVVAAIYWCRLTVCVLLLELILAVPFPSSVHSLPKLVTTVPQWSGSIQNYQKCFLDFFKRIMLIIFVWSFTLF